MGDYNWSSPTALGQEWQPLVGDSIYFSSPDAGVAQRIRPGAITPAAVHRFHPDQNGANPGMALEIVDTLMPTYSVTSVFPGVDVLTTGWLDQAGAAATFARVDDKTDNSDYIKNNAGIGNWEQRSMLFRGNVSALTGKRIMHVNMWAFMRCASFTSTDSIGVEAQLNLGGTNYYGPSYRLHNGLDAFTPLLAVWRLNPSTNKPWTQTEVNLLLQNTGTDEFGIRVSYPLPQSIASGGFTLYGIWLDVYTAPENRVGGFYYDPSRQLTGWQRFPFSGASALSANTWYWLVEYPLIGGGGNYLRGVRHIDANVVEPATASSATGEHRQLVTCTFFGGIATKVTPDLRTVQGAAVTRGQNGAVLAGTLIEGAASAINSQSTPYTYLEPRKIAGDSTANIGQEITSAAATTYGAVRLPVAWNQLGVRPDRELTIEVRHGAGMLTGGGTLDATATLRPDAIDGTYQVVQVPFAAAFLSILNTQYFVLIRSSADTSRGWSIYRLDTQDTSIDTGAGTTAANIEGTTQGGTTDGYAENNTRLTRYDIPVSLIAGPTAPAPVTATAKAAVPGLYPPRVELSWTATALGTAFKAYRVRARPSRAAAREWTVIGEIDVNAGQTAATVEANHNKFTVFDAGWSLVGGQWADGWDYSVSVVHATTGLESTLSTVTQVKLTADVSSWLVSNDAPWLNTSVRATSYDESDAATYNAYTPLGRDLAVTRTRTELPSRHYKVSFNVLDISEDDLRYMRAAALSGRQMTLLMPTGDRVIGTLNAPSVKRQVNQNVVLGDFEFVETSRNLSTTDINLPCAVTLNGSSQFISTADSSLLNAIGAFSLVLCVATVTSGTTKAMLGKGNQFGGGNGYGFATTAVANHLQFYARGVSNLASIDVLDATTFDGSLHAIIGTSTGTAQALYRDGGLTPLGTASITTGSASNAVAFVAGADNGGATAFEAETVVAYAYYQRSLTAAEAQQAAYYVLGYPGARMPGGVSIFHDLRDKRCWNGLTSTITDLSGNTLNGSVTAAPPARGLPWPLADLDRF